MGLFGVPNNLQSISIGVIFPEVFQKNDKLQHRTKHQQTSQLLREEEAEEEREAAEQKRTKKY